MMVRDREEGNNDEELDDDKQMPTCRPDIHLLMVGDPGLGKS